ncbi:MAG: molybdopterin cofactor-binding domain-containing protein [Spirosomataceae bacterium]
MQNIDSYTHLRGESVYLDDIPELQGTLHLAVVESPVAHGRIIRIDFSEALATPGVVRIITYQDIPGENQIGGIVPDEVLLAEDVVDFWGMPIALVAAENEEIARVAAKKVQLEIEKLPVVTDPREAARQGKLTVPPRTFQTGDVATGFALSDYLIEGVAETGGQEHLYLETQGGYAIPTENGGIKLISSTQGPTVVQRHAAKVLGIGMHKIEVETLRLGGGFGGKEDQATAWGVMCALASYLLRRPVKFVLHRMEDMRMTGKRNPYSSDFKIGLDKNLRIVAYEVTFYQNAGCTADLSPAVMERTLFHANNAYTIPNLKATAYSCKTNLPSNTAFRGFGGPQGMFVIEAAIAKAAEEIGVEAAEIQQKNLLKEGDAFHYGQIAEGVETLSSWQQTEERYEVARLRQEVVTFNQQHPYQRKGLAFMPICFGISFTKKFMNQARALVHVYTDGSVGISTGAIEMGQGINTKMLQVVAQVFSIPAEWVKVQATSTFKIANTSPSAASATSDLNGKALQIACDAIVERLKDFVRQELQLTAHQRIDLHNGRVEVDGQTTELDWKKLIQLAYFNRVNLSEHGHYITPHIHFDTTTEKGHPFAYHVYGTALTIATVDCIRGTYEIDAVKVVHDFGKSMNFLVDRGQVEGGIVQGIGWMTMEELLYNPDGKLLSNALSTYKIPDIYSIPKELDLHFMDTEGSEHALLRSKAVGEPPLMYGIGAFFAIRNAVKAFNPASSIGFSAPITPEKVLMGLYSHEDGYLSPNSHEACL